MFGFLKKALGARFFSLSLFNELHHAGEGGILGAFRYGQLQTAALVERSSEEGAANVLGHRHGFAGEARFIDMTGTLDHRTINGHMLAGTKHDNVTGIEFFNAHECGCAIAFQQRLVRSQLEKRVDSALCALQCVALEDIRETKQEQQQGALERLTDYTCADRGQNHKHIHVQSAATQGSHCRTHTLLTTEEVSATIEDPCGHSRFA